MPECDHCGATVSDRYAAVFGDNRGVLRRCRHCVPLPEIYGGAGADPRLGLENRVTAPLRDVVPLEVSRR